MKGKNFLLSFTVGGPAEAYRTGGYNNFEISDLLNPLLQTSNLMGTNYMEPIYSHSMIYIPGVYNVKEEVEERARQHAERLFEAVAGA